MKLLIGINMVLAVIWFWIMVLQVIENEKERNIKFSIGQVIMCTLLATTFAMIPTVILTTGIGMIFNAIFGR